MKRMRMNTKEAKKGRRSRQEVGNEDVVEDVDEVRVEADYHYFVDANAASATEVAPTGS